MNWRNVLTFPLIAFIQLYRWTLSPILGMNCRFQPNCSSYAIEALRVHGPLKGSWLAVWRVLRCNPWATWGYDPVPPRARDENSDLKV